MRAQRGKDPRRLISSRVVKALSIALFGVAAVGLGVVAWRAPSRNYVAPTLEEVLAHDPAPDRLLGDVPAGSVVRTLEVEGMCCHGCTGKLYAKLKATPGVTQAAVSFERGTAQVVVPESADAGAFARVLTFDKYTAKLAP